ncbi:hypothetical protein G5C51_13725 [Streptomyces sp. A7024]|uniref:DUF4352 domain-containing protein n=1 Tax=Streptomyces coryli TaxID=1128680 RepID=A0A6G4TYW5_9ACTN|nr:FxLYD domain-containing protein [Streptomyces coryli]NGN64952.1 hypothetical protein [Streptomyces coryli]
MNTPTPAPAHPQQPKTKRTLGKIVTIAAAGLIGIGIISAMTGGSDTADAEDKPSATGSKHEAPVSSSANRANPPEKDVTVGPFEATDHGYGFKEGKATVTIVNHSAKKSDYFITLEFLDKSGNRIAEDYASTEALAPGQTSKETVGAAVESEKVDQVAKVKVTEVERFSSEY